MPDGAANAYGSIRTQLEKRGETICNNELWIVAHAKAAELILVTNKEGKFRWVAGLKVQNWAK